MEDLIEGSLRGILICRNACCRKGGQSGILVGKLPHQWYYHGGIGGGGVRLGGSYPSGSEVRVLVANYSSIPPPSPPPPLPTPTPSAGFPSGTVPGPPRFPLTPPGAGGPALVISGSNGRKQPTTTWTTGSIADITTPNITQLTSSYKY